MVAMPDRSRPPMSVVDDLVEDVSVAQLPDVTPDEIRLAFRQLAATVSVVTLHGRDGRPRGMTATSMSALSIHPPTLLVCVDRATRTHRELAGATAFGVDLLAADQQDVAVFCARRGTDKVLPARWLDPIGNPESAEPPRIGGALVQFGCTIEAIHPAATHDIVIGRIRTVTIARDKAPLLYQDGAFRHLAADHVSFAAAVDEADES